MDRQKIERSIKGLSEWQMHVQAESDIDTNISTAIEALKAQHSQEGTTKDATSDTISRQQAIDALMDAVKKVGILDADDIKAVFDMLPIIQPVRKFRTAQKVIGYLSTRCKKMILELICVRNVK